MFTSGLGGVRKDSGWPWRLIQANIVILAIPGLVLLMGMSDLYLKVYGLALLLFTILFIVATIAMSLRGNPVAKLIVLAGAGLMLVQAVVIGVASGNMAGNFITRNIDFFGTVFYQLLFVSAISMFVQGLVDEHNTAVVQSKLAEDKNVRLQETFGRYFSEEVMETLLSDDEQALEGQERWVTVLFSDLASYSTIIESMSPVQVVKLLNSYLTAMQEIIEEHHGVILEYIGDAILVVFGAPNRLEDHQEHSVRCAVAMRERLDQLNQEWLNEGTARYWKNRGIDNMNCRIGLHTGSVVAGNLGSDRHMKYGIVGDAVNIAARLEQKNKELGTTILMSAEVQGSLPVAMAETLEDQGLMAIKGREQSKRIYSI